MSYDLNTQRRLFPRSLDELIDNSIALLQSHPEGQPWQLCFSGGKDSIVMLDLAKKAGVDYKAIMQLTGIDIPEVIKHTRLHYPDVTQVKLVNFWDLLKRKGLPSFKFRWCCQSLREKSFPGYKGILIGVRSEESTKRSKLSEVSVLRKRLCIYPIFNWPEWAIWDYIEANSLPYPKKIYSVFGRTGCVVCPLRNPNDLAKYKEMFPQIFRCYEHCAKIWYDRRVANGKIPYEDFDTCMKHWYANRGMTKLWR